MEVHEVHNENVIGQKPKPYDMETVEAPKVTQEEYDLLTRCVMAEAGNQGTLGQRLVCAVILNRVESKRFPNSIQGVISQQGQFETYPTAIWKVKPSKEVKNAVDEELNNRINNQILFFRTNYYHKGTQALFKEGAHYFSK